MRSTGHTCMSRPSATRLNYTKHGHLLRFFLTAKVAKNAKENLFLCALRVLGGSIGRTSKTAICCRAKYIYGL